MAAISTLKMLKMMKQKMMMLRKVDLVVFKSCSSNPTRTALLPFLVTCSYIWGKVQLKCKFGFHCTVHTLKQKNFGSRKTLEVQTMHVTSLQFTASSRVSRNPTSPPKAWRIVAANGWQDGKTMQANMLHQQKGSGSQTNVSWESRRSKPSKIQQ